MIASLREIARALGGEVVGGQALVPGPCHGKRDRSLSITLSATAPDGFLAFSHAGDDFRTCRDHIRARLGIAPDDWRQDAPRRAARAPGRAPSPVEQNDDHAERTAAAVALWRSAVDPRGTLVETYLKSRNLELGADVAGDVLRWHPGTGTMLALFRSISTGRPQAVSRTFLDRDARKIGRKFLGPVGGAAIMLDGFHDVLGGILIGEGCETALSAPQLGLKPTWALGSCGAVAAFPVMAGIECLTLLAEHDEASARAVEQCAARWHAAGKEVLINESVRGKDLNDALRGAA